MTLLENKKVILAVSGSIAAYKTPELVRQLIKAGAEVQVLMTPGAQDFVTPLSLSTVSKKAVLSEVSDGEQWNNHVQLGLWADLMIVAPAGANTIARLANGICDNIVSAVYLSARCPVVLAPAMDEDMWKHPSTQSNIERLRSYGNHIIDVTSGELASGLTGPGRMEEPGNIVKWCADFFKTHVAVVTGSGKKKPKALVTAGPTYEHIDPVRFIGNFSSGKMGIAIAEALADRGYEVEVVLGPSKENSRHPGVSITRVVSADEMYAACIKHFPKVEIAVMSAAVADFKPAQAAGEKIKKGRAGEMQIHLVRNPDILFSLGKIKKAGQTLVGFALETNNELEYAYEKLKKKNADFIALNSLRDPGAGFGGDTNKVTLIGKRNFKQEFPLQSKAETAKAIVDCVIPKK